MMRYWVFHGEQLDNALATFEAERMAQGATELQARDESILIKLFLLSPAASGLARSAS